MYQKKGISSRNLIISLIIAYTIMPIVSRFISTYLTTYFYMFVLVSLFTVTVLGNKSDSINEYVGGLLLPFIIFQSLSYINRTDSIVLWGYSFLLWLVPIVVGYYITQYSMDNINYFSGVIVVTVGITIVTTCFGLIRFPYAARILATISSSQDTNAITYNWYNIGGYAFVYFVVLLYPILILAYKQKKINIIVALIGTISIFLMVILSEYATAFLLIMISSTLYFMDRNFSKRGVWILLIASLLLILFLNNYVSQFLTYISSITGSETIAERFAALAGGKTGLESSESNRIALYRKSFSTFLSSPFLGSFLSGGGGLGGHSFILDNLGRYGLIGIVLLFLMYRKIYLYFIAIFENQSGYGYVLWAFLQAIILSIVNTGMWLEVLTIMIPILVCCIYGWGDTEYEDSLDC